MINAGPWLKSFLGVGLVERTYIPCPVEHQQNGSCALEASWAAVDAAYRSALAAERTVYLGIFGLVVGTLTLVAAFYAAIQARRAADAAIRDATANAEAAKQIADDRQRQIEAQARIHGAKLSFADCQFQFYKEDRFQVRFLLENNGETGAELESLTFSLNVRLGDRHEDLFERVDIPLVSFKHILPGQQFSFSLDRTFFQHEGIVSDQSWFELRGIMDIVWFDTFDFKVIDKLVGMGTAVVQSITNTLPLRLDAQKREPRKL